MISFTIRSRGNHCDTLSIKHTVFTYFKIPVKYTKTQSVLRYEHVYICLLVRIISDKKSDTIDDLCNYFATTVQTRALFIAVLAQSIMT